MNHIAVRIDVTEALPPDVTERATIEIAAWIFRPIKRKRPRPQAPSRC